MEDMLKRIKRYLYRYFDVNFKKKLTNEESLSLTFFNSTTILSPIKFKGENYIGKYTEIIGPIEIGLCSTIGSNCFLEGEIEIGNYTQIGPHVTIHAVDHDTKKLSIYNSNSLFNGRLKQHIIKSKIVIGNDCWIGSGSHILKGVQIGNGCVVAAGSVVTKNLPPFSIVAGIPAKVIKMRFSDSLIEKISESKWWEKKPQSLTRYEKYFHINVDDHDEDITEFMLRLSDNR